VDRRLLVAGVAMAAVCATSLGTAGTAAGATDRAPTGAATTAATGSSRAVVVKGTTRVLGSSRSTRFVPGRVGRGGRAANPEIAKTPGERSPGGGEARSSAVRQTHDRSIAKKRVTSTRGLARAAAVAPGAITPTGAKLVRSFNGLNHFDSRYADNGNQYSNEPPDQALCVGNGFVVEGVNSVVRVDTTTGRRGATMSLNTFFGLPSWLNRATGVNGPSVFDPTCVFDPSTKTFFFVADELGTTAAGDYTGAAYLDIAVTQNPLRSWRVYRMPVTDNGSKGTPVHPNCPCFGDYPHIGFDAHGFYISTNEFPIFTDGYNSAQIYAFDKRALATGARTIYVTQFDTSEADQGLPGFTVWPAHSPSAADFNRRGGGTEYFLSSLAVFNDETGVADQLSLWTMTGTSTLGRAHPTAALSVTRFGVRPYAVPPPVTQKGGRAPLLECLNTPACRPTTGADPGPAETLAKLDSNDSRMQQVMYAHGLLWGALDTAVNLGSQVQAGIAWYAVKPYANRRGTFGSVVNQGQFGLPDHGLTYPAVGVTSAGRGVIGFTLAGRRYYPSAAFAGVSARGLGPVKFAAWGVGVQDGFTGYKAFVGGNGVARWGDYGAASVVGGDVWVASEYIAQRCTLAQYTADPTCGRTRSALANWGTRISLIRP
jgi:hypothetical protein